MSIAVNSVGLLMGAGGALSPVLAAILHNASSVAVVTNSSRLIHYQLANGRPPGVNGQSAIESKQTTRPEDSVVHSVGQ